MVSGQDLGVRTPGTSTASEIQLLSQRVQGAVESVIQGKSTAVRTAITTLLAGGHLLIEDVPGVGKTMLSKALAASIDSTVRRIQFTPDLLPTDVTGVSVYNQETRSFEFHPGAIFANIVIGDEINRASPKTQSAMLECMAERQVTIENTTYSLQRPFMVIATQNPIEMEGTYALPEAQRDRFMSRISMGYPIESAEIEMVAAREQASPLEVLRPVASATEVQSAIAGAARIYTSEAIHRYAVAIARATREAAELRLGASPRAVLQLVSAARANAAMVGRDYVIPDDISTLAPTVLTHRLLPARVGAGAHAGESGTPAMALDRILKTVPVPS